MLLRNQGARDGQVCLRGGSMSRSSMREMGLCFGRTRDGTAWLVVANGSEAGAVFGHRAFSVCSLKFLVSSLLPFVVTRVDFPLLTPGTLG